MHINSSTCDVLIPCNKRITFSGWLLKSDCIFNRIFAWILNIVGRFAYGICIAKIIDDIILNNFPTCSNGLHIDSSTCNVLIPCNKRITFSGRFLKSDCVFNRIFAWILNIISCFAYGICIAKIIDDIILNNFPTCSDCNVACCAFFDILVPSCEPISCSCRCFERDCIFHCISGDVHAVVNVLAD